MRPTPDERAALRDIQAQLRQTMAAVHRFVADEADAHQAERESAERWRRQLLSGVSQLAATVASYGDRLDRVEQRLRELSRA